MSDVEVMEYTEGEMRNLREQALRKVGMTLGEYRAYVADKCHPKCWRPDSANGNAWASIDVWDMLLEEGRHAKAKDVPVDEDRLRRLMFAGRNV
jgi:hypothetical protein